MKDIARQPRKGLGFWGFFLSLLLCFVAWWGVGQLTEPRPVWTRRFTANQQILLPLSQAADTNKLVAYEMNLNPDKPSECNMTGVVILDSLTGATQYRLPLPNDPWRPEQYIMQTSQQALPRIIGEVVWRINIVETEKAFRCELRAWHYTQSQQEKVVQSWDYTPDSLLDVAFAGSSSPYMITQTRFRCELFLAGLGMEGWSSLTAQIAYGQALGMRVPGEQELRVNEPTEHRGLVLSTIHTWKLPAYPSEALTPLAGWMLPPMRTVWPPVCGKDMNWVAFGDLPTRLPLRVAQSQPPGVLLFDGHTGKPRSHSLSSASPLFVSEAGDLLMTTSQAVSKETRKEGFQNQIIDPQTGKELALPSELANTEHPVIIFPDHSQPGRYLATIGIGEHPFYQEGFPVEKSVASVGQLQRTETGFQLIKPLVSLTYEVQQKSLMTTHGKGNEIGILGSKDIVPPLLRTLFEKWDWLKTWTDKYWPRDSMALMLFDINNGKSFRHIQDAMVMQRFNASSKDMLYTITYHRGPPPGRESIEALCAWRLPIETLGTSPWWGRGAGLLVFFLAILHLVRRRPRAA